MEKKCNHCETKVEMQRAEPPKTVDYFVYEGTVERYERTVKRLWIALVVVVSLFFATNIGWLIYESQFETISYEQDGDGLNNVNLGEQGDLNNGAEGKDKTEAKE